MTSHYVVDQSMISICDLKNNVRRLKPSIILVNLCY